MVKFAERELEDYAEANLGKLSASILWSDAKIMDMLGRQVPCAFGRIDMLASHLYTIYVIEFKAVKATEKELGQVMRYCSIVEYTLDPYKHMSFANFDTLGAETIWNVCPVLVAPGFSDNLFSTNCMLIHAEKDGNGFAFNRAYRTGMSQVFKLQNAKLSEAILPFEKQVAGIGIGNRIKNNLSVFMGA